MIVFESVRKRNPAPLSFIVYQSNASLEKKKRKAKKKLVLNVNFSYEWLSGHTKNWVSGFYPFQLMFAAPGCLTVFSTSLITFKGKSHVTSAVHSPTTSSSNCITNTTIPAAIAMALIELLLLRHGRNLGLRSSHLSR